MLLHRYSDINYILNLDINTGCALIIKAREEKRDERIFRQWAAQLSSMALIGETMSFEAYKERVTGANIDTRPTNQILAELDEVEKLFTEGGQSDGDI